jgi:hypothetical protein
MNSSDRLVGSCLPERIEQFDQARLVKITRRALAIWLHPFRLRAKARQRIWGAQAAGLLATAASRRGLLVI